jgi:preprotein translocase subunit SecD
MQGGRAMQKATSGNIGRKLAVYLLNKKVNQSLYR